MLTLPSQGQIRHIEHEHIPDLKRPAFMKQTVRERTGGGGGD